MAQGELTGRCFCGAVRYRAAAGPVDVSTCYCADCTRAVGSGVTTWAQFPTSGFRFVRGQPVRFESSPGVTRTFCGHCGSSLTYHYADGQKLDVSTATLDEPHAHPPTWDGPNRPEWLDRLSRARGGGPDRA